MKRVCFGLLLALGLFQGALAQRVTIHFWNAMGGSLATTLNGLIAQFEQQYPQYHIVNDYKGDYPTLLTSLVAAYRAGHPPAIAQVYEIGTALMMSERQAIVPVQTLMTQAGYPLTPNTFLPAIGYYYASRQGQLMSLPFNSSSPVMYVNRAEFKRAGLTLADIPRTWPEVKSIGLRLQAAGVHCAITTAWPAWIQLEELSAWHNVPYASADNGFASFDVKALYDNPMVIHHVAFLAQLERQHLFEYGGQGDSAESLFTSGQCAMMLESSGARGGIEHNVGFPVSVAMMPYWPNVKGAPQNTIIGGASLWVVRGQSKAVYQGVATFFHFLLEPKTQLEFQRQTGYLPLTHAGFAYAKKLGYYRDTPGAIVAVRELTNKAPTAYSRGIRLGNFPQIRVVNNTALESVFSGQATAAQALHRAARQADVLLNRFSEMTQ